MSNDNKTVEDVRNLIVCDTQFGWTGSTTLRLQQMLALQERGWLVEGAENNEFDLTDAGREVVARALQAAVQPTLADVQPGGRVRLEDQAERARFEEWLATQHDQGSEHVMAKVSDTDDRYQSPVTSSMWSAWQAANAAREGGRINGWRVIDGVRVYSAYAHASILDDQQYVRYEDYLAALSAQPSPGGQVD
ncbi:hypothetical protein AR275_32290 [Stenotrophomonas maltophilia]|nr:hypothetical protein AR275_32290 [Stenotrophomonas maltophilia]